jgi:hypothetical protein
MGHRRDTPPARIDRRDFMRGATTALSALGLAAASLPRPAFAEGGVPKSGPAGKPKKPKTEQFAIHQDVPVIISLDVGALDVGAGGPTIGDSFYFHADLRLEPAVVAIL